MFWKGQVKSSDLKLTEMLWKDEEASSSCEETHQHPGVEAVLNRGTGNDSTKSISRTVQKLLETFCCSYADILSVDSLFSVM